ncbi:MAG TPA: four helix bundle protein [Anaerolineae bacterium]|nr:four helix bundle protein [Anaerolineae bacterium]
MEQGYKGYKGATARTYRKLYGYKNLLAWQVADDLAACIHEIVVSFPPRYFKLADQMLGSATSVKANIGEGYCLASDNYNYRAMTIRNAH